MYMANCLLGFGWLWQTKPRTCTCLEALCLLVWWTCMEITLVPLPFGLGLLWWTKPQGKV